jgi:hypothetical protein
MQQHKCSAQLPAMRALTNGSGEELRRWSVSVTQTNMACGAAVNNGKVLGMLALCTGAKR